MEGRTANKGVNKAAHKAARRRAVTALLVLGLAAMLELTGCMGRRGADTLDSDLEAAAAEQTLETAKAARTAEETDEASKPPVIGLILTSMDADENESVQTAFQEAAEAVGAELLVGIPEVTEAAAAEAAALANDFVLCEVDPVEFQMLYVNQFVAEDVDVIAIHANHREALEPVLAAARAVGIRVCAFGLDVGENASDLYADAEKAPEAVLRLLLS